MHRRAWIPAIALGLAGAILLPQPVVLADPPVCAGLLELAAMVASRTARDVPLAGMIGWGNRAAVLIALMLFVRLLQTRSDTWLARLSGGATIAALMLSSAFVPTLAPSAVAAFAAACGAMLAVAGATSGGRALSTRSFATLAGALALLAAIAPALLVPCALATLVLAPNLTAGVVAAVAVTVGPVLVHAAIPPIPMVGDGVRGPLSCAVPRTVASGAITIVTQTAFGPISLFAICLAALGAFAMRTAWRWPRAWWMVAFAIVPLAVAATGESDPMRTLAPALVAFWALVAIGLHELVLAIGPTKWRWVGVAGVLVAVPWLQLSGRAQLVPPESDRIRGHDRLTRQNFLQLLSAVPAGAAIVVEDAVVSILAHDADRRLAASGRPLLMAARDLDAVARAISTSRVFTLPRAQSVVRHFGYRLHDVAHAAGLTEITRGGDCVAADDTWRDASGFRAADGLALVARDESARGPAVVHLGSHQELSPERSWPRRAQRGFAWRQYDRDRESERTELAERLPRMSAPADHAVFQSRYVTVLEIWRVSDGPRVLPVTMKAAPDAALVVRRDDATPGTVWVCPSFKFEVIGIFETR